MIEVQEVIERYIKRLNLNFTWFSWGQEMRPDVVYLLIKDIKHYGDSMSVAFYLNAVGGVDNSTALQSLYCAIPSHMVSNEVITPKGNYSRIHSFLMTITAKKEKEPYIKEIKGINVSD
jgi:hypothetical protein